MTSARPLTFAAAAVCAALTLSSCAGSAGAGGSSGGEAGAGFEYDADQAAVDEALADLDPVTLTYQPAAASPESIMAPAAYAYQDYIEERSGGKITLEMVWGQAIAGYAEVDDALADGRLDLSYSLPIYNPSDYPSFDATASALSGLPISPVRGEAIYNAVAGDLGWQTESLLDEYEAKGVTPLTPMVASGGYYPICNEEGSEPDDWEGRQIRVASTSHLNVTQELGASPVSMEYVEVFEALQRGTVDCTFAQLLPSAESQLFDVAPHLSYSTDEASMASRAVGAELAGSSFETLPLAYQQIIFDAAQSSFAGFVNIVADGNTESVRQVKEADGTIEQIDEETEKIISDANAAELERILDDGLLSDDVPAKIDESTEKWTSVADELGIEDKGDFEDLDEWWEEGVLDFAPMGKRVYEETGLAHRPS
ncbi:MAG: TRAP transporter substrate-binding protein DctP [Brevibacterium yomogidense]|uniref:TRAP-type C4-dicarboxylate transport system, periplasmic component n=1 Tax=Brevibacterium yomogidense TaxID=946573 RepID=A0A1X6XJ88_9MICO|nr:MULTISPECIES: TRAP transporter substrate-binding protein DctP [Brevibacterium]SLM99352.1 TRAP-type C4-dicarboxylate transport system, periplasmic component [Brevibacterium yomogidense]SMX97798.1 TRAP-type C4-dicarboxylate transport system, substrate-binding protein [Brevibacterium sp. Mu109]